MMFMKNVMRYLFSIIKIKKKVMEMKIVGMSKEERDLLVDELTRILCDLDIENKEDVIDSFNDLILVKERNLKPFNMEEARKGKKVIDDEGHEVRILCFDKSGDNYPVVALIKDDNGYECLKQFTKEGMYITTGETKMDLKMAPVDKQGWVNLYRSSQTGKVYCGETICDSEYRAKEIHENDGDEKVDIVRIRWTE